MEIHDGELKSGAHTLLAGISGEVRAEDGAREGHVFLTAHAEAPSSRSIFRLGVVPELIRFTVCHRYEPYWMKPRAGTRLSEVPAETLCFLGELRRGRWLLLVPLLGELFRFSLRGTKDDGLELLGETGDAFAPGLGGLALYAAVGEDPFTLARAGAEAVAKRLDWGRLRRDKALPDFTDFFGWCTWDAFYQDVSAKGVRAGLEQFAKGGIPPKWVILDDGWQATRTMPTGERRLASFSANDKFSGDLAATVRMAKEEFGVATFLVWHTIVGYWGGVDGSSLPGYEIVDQTRQFGEGVLAHVPSFNHDWWGNLVGFVPTRHVGRFFDDYHSSLRAAGVDGLKVDSQAVLEAVAQGQGGRIRVARAYRQALEASASKYFGERLVNCMSNGQETWYGSARSTLLRSSIDFFPAMPETHGAHLYTNAQVGLWFGEFMQPDWDMFQSGHEWGTFHAAGRAISGGPVYVSDKPGHHDFALLAKLVCSDGSVLRCDGPGRPTLDNLCVDPTRDDVLLKIWNRCGETAAVVGVFNARYCPQRSEPLVLEGSVSPADVPALTSSTYACYAHNAKRLTVLAADGRVGVALAERDFELFTLVPIERGFAPIGLADKFNSAGALRGPSWCDDGSYRLELRDGGDFLAWSAAAPTSVEVDCVAASFTYSRETNALRVPIALGGHRNVRIRF
jgi:raffinose synthase